jgi:hypothetical protein
MSSQISLPKAHIPFMWNLTPMSFLLGLEKFNALECSQQYPLGDRSMDNSWSLSYLSFFYFFSFTTEWAGTSYMLIKSKNDLYRHPCHIIQVLVISVLVSEKELGTFCQSNYYQCAWYAFHSVVKAECFDLFFFLTLELKGNLRRNWLQYFASRLGVFSFN